MVQTTQSQPSTDAPVARSGTPQASPIATLVVSAAQARANWAEIDEDYQHLVAQLELDLIKNMPSEYTTEVTQRAWLTGQLYQQAAFRQIVHRRLQAYRAYCLRQAEVDANHAIWRERITSALDGSGTSVFAGLAEKLHSHGGGTGFAPNLSPMDQADTGGAEDTT